MRGASENLNIEATKRAGELDMLLEHLVERAQQEPEHDWEGYYNWRFSELTGRDVKGLAFWQCQKCLATNLLTLPARYGKCRCCELIHLP